MYYSLVEDLIPFTLTVEGHAPWYVKAGAVIVIYLVFLTMIALMAMAVHIGWKVV